MLVGRLAERLERRTWQLSEGFASLRSTRRASAIAFAPSETLATAVAQTAAVQAGSGD